MSEGHSLEEGIMNKDDLRRQLAVLPWDKAFALAVKEASFWDVRQLNNQRTFKGAVLQLCVLHPAEAASLINQVPPLLGAMLLYNIRRLCQSENKCKDRLRVFGLCAPRLESCTRNLLTLAKISRGYKIPGDGY